MAAVVCFVNTADIVVFAAGIVVFAAGIVVFAAGIVIFAAVALPKNTGTSILIVVASVNAVTATNSAFTSRSNVHHARVHKRRAGGFAFAVPSRSSNLSSRNALVQL